MSAQLEAGLNLVDAMPECIVAKFKSASDGAFDSASDDRGQAYVFDRQDEPAVFIELITTNPHKVRGNHVHQNCVETFSVLTGKLEFYLLCTCAGRHVYKQTMTDGDTVITGRGVAHAIYTLEKTEFVAFFDHSPKNDRERVPILVF